MVNGEELTDLEKMIKDCKWYRKDFDENGDIVMVYDKE